MDRPVAALVLAAGQGTRMKSPLPKVLHVCAGLPMVEWVRRAVSQAGVEQCVVVVGHGAEAVTDTLRRADPTGQTKTALQPERLGTGHATQCGLPALEGFTGSVLVVCGDTPLLRAETLRALVAEQQASGAACVMATMTLNDPTGYGRVIRNESGQVVGIVEQKDATDAQRLVKEVNPAVYCFEVEALRAALPQLKNANAQGEYYLTDVIGLLVAGGQTVKAVVSPDTDEFLGVNDRWQLAQAAEILKARRLRELTLNGVSIVDLASTVVGPDVEIGPETTLYPNTVIEGNTTIGSGCHIGPNSWIKSCRIADDVRVFMSHMEDARMESGTRCGPFSNLRPGAHLQTSAKIGNFVEIKNATIGSQTSISHLTYIGDAQIGQRSNIGAGTITCNYDGFAKHITQIGDDCFVGSNSTLVAPLTIGHESMVAAGSVITKDVPEGSMALGRSRQEVKEGWFRAWRKRKSNT